MSDRAIKVLPYAHLWWQHGQPYRPRDIHQGTEKVFMRWGSGNSIKWFKSIAKTSNKLDEVKVRSDSAKIKRTYAVLGQQR